MKNLLIVATSALCVLLAVAVPLPEQDVQIVQIPLEGDKELDILSLPENNEGQLTDRNKRTIGVLRQLFPELSKKVEQVIEEKIQLILPIIFRNVGPLLLNGGLGGLSGGGGNTASNDDDDDDFGDNDDDNSGSSTSTRTGAGGRKVSISLPTFPPDTEDEYEDESTQSNTANDNKEESNTVQSKEESSTTAKSMDTTQVSITQKPIVTTNPIQSSTKPTVTTIIAETTTKTTTFELETTQSPSISSTIPPLIRTSIETRASSINNDNNNDSNNDTHTTIPSSLMSTSPDDESTENVFGTSESTTDSIEITSIQMQNIDENDSVETTTTISKTTQTLINDGILTFQESITDNDYSDETTTGSKDIDFSRLIDPRSLKDSELYSTSQDLADVEETTTSKTILSESEVDTTAGSSNDRNNIACTSETILSKEYLPISQNLVRRRKSVVIKRQHIH